jgi:hypothetical protein
LKKKFFIAGIVFSVIAVVIAIDLIDFVIKYV